MPCPFQGVPQGTPLGQVRMGVEWDTPTMWSYTLPDRTTEGVLATRRAVCLLRVHAEGLSSFNRKFELFFWLCLCVQIAKGTENFSKWIFPSLGGFSFILKEKVPLSLRLDHRSSWYSWLLSTLSVIGSVMNCNGSNHIRQIFWQTCGSDGGSFTADVLFTQNWKRTSEYGGKFFIGQGSTVKMRCKIRSMWS